MSYWTPSGTFVSVGVAASATIVVASNQAGGVARAYNINSGSTSYIAIVSASATVGEGNFVPVPPIGMNVAFFAFSGTTAKIIVSNATCLVNPGYMLK